MSTVIESGFRAMLAQYGETITYVPAAGEEREITAIVRRPAATAVPPADAWSGPAITVSVLNDATEGIAGSELDSGQDNVKVAQRPGGTAQSRPVGRIVAINEVKIDLEIR